MRKRTSFLHIFSVILTFLLVASIQLRAQDSSSERKFLVGLTGGATISSGVYRYTDGPEPPSFSPFVFFGAGVSMDYRLRKSLSLQSLFLYRAKGDRINMESWAREFYDLLAPVSDPGFFLDAEGYSKTDLRYLEWTFCPNLVVADHLEMGVGLFTAIGINGRETEDYRINYYWEGQKFRTVDVLEERKAEFARLIQWDTGPEKFLVKRIDYGLTGRLGYRLGFFTLATCVHYSLTHREPTINDLFGSQQPLNKTHHLTGFLALTWYPRKKLSNGSGK